MSYKKHRGVLIPIILFLATTGFLSWKIFDYHKTSSLLSFTQSDIKKIWVFDDKFHGLSYDYKMSDIDVERISSILVNIKRDRVKNSDLPSASSDLSFMIMLNGYITTNLLNGVVTGYSPDPDRVIYLIPGDGESVRIILQKRQERDKSFVIKSAELSSFLNGVRSEFGL